MCTSLIFCVLNLSFLAQSNLADISKTGQLIGLELGSKLRSYRSLLVAGVTNTKRRYDYGGVRVGKKAEQGWYGRIGMKTSLIPERDNPCLNSERKTDCKQSNLITAQPISAI